MTELYALPVTHPTKYFKCQSLCGWMYGILLLYHAKAAEQIDEADETWRTDRPCPGYI